MKLTRIDLFLTGLIFLISVLFVLDNFLAQGRPATFDALFHITNIAQFHKALQEGDFPVVWTGGIGNYGLPMAIVAHQLTNYLGGLLTFLTLDPFLSFNIVALIGVFLSGLFYFVFLRLYFPSLPSFAGTFLFTFTSYKIINFYIRGAVPEIFSGMFLPLMLIGMYYFIKRKKIFGMFLVAFSSLLLTLNHPMMLFIYSFIFFPYLLFLLTTQDGVFNIKSLKKLKTIALFIVTLFAIFLGVGMGSYYLLPLNLELKYFYYGQINNHLVPDNYLSWWQFFRTDWQFFTDVEIYPRGHIIMPGIIEACGIVLGVLYIAWKFLVRKKRTVSIVEFSVAVSILLIFFMTKYSHIFYTNISLLSNIQYPWRMLSGLLFLAPIVYVYFLTKLKHVIFILGFILIISLLQFPQLYVKNVVAFPKSIYYFTPFNVHSVQMNTIWTGKTEEYPVKTTKPEIITGDGVIRESEIKNSSRMYTIDAKTPLRMVDNTFYFPGWKVYVDGTETPIEFQDPVYRGVITYNLPEGSHVVDLRFEDTKIRSVGKVLSLFFAGIFFVLFFWRKKVQKLIYS